MYESYYEPILKYLRDNDIKYGYEIKIEASEAILKEALEEMDSIGYITYASFFEVYLSNKGLAYLELTERRSHAIQTNIIAMQKKSKLSFIKSISLMDWAALATIIATVIALFYLIKDIIKN